MSIQVQSRSPNSHIPYIALTFQRPSIARLVRAVLGLGEADVGCSNASRAQSRAIGASNRYLDANASSVSGRAASRRAGNWNSRSRPFRTATSRSRRARAPARGSANIRTHCRSPGTNSALSRPRIMIELRSVDPVVAVVDVGRDERDVRRRGLPDLDHVPVRTAARAILGAFFLERIAERGVGVHRQVELGLAGGGDLVDIARGVPGVERLVGFPAVDLRPGSALAGLARECGRDRLGEQPVGLGREIARRLRSCRSRSRPAP